MNKYKLSAPNYKESEIRYLICDQEERLTYYSPYSPERFIENKKYTFEGFPTWFAHHWPNVVMVFYE